MQPDEARRGGNLVGADGLQHANTNSRIADVDLTFGQRQIRVSYADGGDARPVERSRIEKAPSALLELGAAMKARNERIGQDQMIARVRTNARDVAVVQNDTLSRDAVLLFDGELEPRNGDRLAAALRDFHASPCRDHRQRARLTSHDPSRHDGGRTAP